MGGLGDRLSVDVNCARQIDEQRFDHRSICHVVGDGYVDCVLELV
jgi:hypothetical protein